MKLSTAILSYAFGALAFAAGTSWAADTAIANSDATPMIKGDFDGDEIDIFVIAKLEMDDTESLTAEDHEFMAKALVESYNEVYSQGHPGIGLKDAQFFSEEETLTDLEFLGDKKAKATKTYLKTEWNCDFCAAAAKEAALVGGIRGGDGSAVMSAEDQKKLFGELMEKNLGYPHHLHPEWMRTYCRQLDKYTASKRRVRYCHIILTRPW